MKIKTIELQHAEVQAQIAVIQKAFSDTLKLFAEAAGGQGADLFKPRLANLNEELDRLVTMSERLITEWKREMGILE